MEQKTLQEVVHKKKAMEEMIFHIVANFEKEFKGVHINSVDLSRLDFDHGDFDIKKLLAVKIELGM